MKPFYKSQAAVTFGLLLMGTSAFAETGTGLKELLKDPLAWGFAVAVLFMLITLAALNKALNTVRAMSTHQQQSQEESSTVAAPIQEESSLMQALTGAKPIEKEADILLDHDYDGIHELDNDLPPWWKWGFYITIVYAIVYVIFFFGTGAIPSSDIEYNNEMAEEQAKVEAYLAATGGAVNESNVELLTDDASIAAGKEIYAANCVACHLADGGGLVGPNFTDEYWIHGGGIVEVFTTIKYGVPAKGMIAWEDQLGAVAMQQVASYILTLQGTTPATPKAPEGEKWGDDNAEPEATPAEGEADASETETETDENIETENT